MARTLVLFAVAAVLITPAWLAVAQPAPPAGGALALLGLPPPRHVPQDDLHRHHAAFAVSYGRHAALDPDDVSISMDEANRCG